MNSYTNKDEIFSELLKKHKNEIFQYAKVLVRDDYAADDMAQEAFLELYKHFEEVELKKVASYLKTVIHNRYCNYLRDCKYLRDISLDNMHENQGKASSAEDVYLRKIEEKVKKALANNIMEMLREKSEEWYEVISWCYYTNRSMVELARLKGVSARVLYARKDRAEGWIRKTYAKMEKEQKRESHKGDSPE